LGTRDDDAGNAGDVVAGTVTGWVIAFVVLAT
jgi:hypothetical protein